MPLAEQLIEFPFTGGVDEKAGHEHVILPSMLEATNCLQKESGVYEKRGGFRQIATNNSPSVCRKVFAHNDELALLTAGGQLFRRNAVSETWNRGGLHISETPETVAPPCVITRRRAAANGHQGLWLVDSDIANGYMCIVGTKLRQGISGNGIMLTVIELATGNVVVDNKEISSNMIEPRVCVVGTSFVIVFYDDSVPRLRTIVVSTTSGISIGSENTVTTCDTNAEFDITPVSATEFACLTEDSAVAILVVMEIAGFTFRATYVSTDNPTGSTAMAIHWEQVSDVIVCAYVISPNVRIFGRNNDGTLTSAFAEKTLASRVAAVDPTQMTMINEVTSADDIFILFAAADPGGTATARPTISFLDFNGSDGTVNTTRKDIYGFDMNSRLFRAPNRGPAVVISIAYDPDQNSGLAGDPWTKVFSGVVGASTAQYAYWAVAVDKVDFGAAIRFFPLARFADLEATGHRFEQNTLTRISQVSTNIFAGAFPIQFGIETGFSSVRADIVEFDFAHRSQWTPVKLGDDTLLTGGIPCLYDGFNFAEVAPGFYPWLLDGNDADKGVAGFADGNWDYRLSYSIRTRSGNLIRSNVSDIFNVVVDSGTGGFTAGNGKIVLDIPTLTVTLWPDSAVHIHIWRRNGGTSNPFLHVGTVENDPTSEFVTFEDVNPATLGAEIHLSAGELPAEPPPSCKYATVWKNRVWLGGLEDPAQIWYSKEYLKLDSVNFSSLQSLRIEEAGDGVAGVAPMDDTLVIFMTDRIYRMYGDGPNEFGQGATLTQPTLVSSEFGVTNGWAIMLTKHGLIHRNRQGLYLLDRGFGNTYIGAQIEDTLATYPILVASINIPGTQLYAFGLTDGAGNGAFVVWDDQHKAWYVWDHDFNIDVYPETMTVVDGVWYWSDSTDDGNNNFMVFRYDPSINYDVEVDANSHHIDVTVITPWLPGELVPWYRTRKVHAVLRKDGAHDLGIDAQYDFDRTAAWVTLKYWTWTEITAVVGSLERHERLRADITKQINQSVRFRIRLRQGTGQAATTIGARLVGLALEVAKKRRAAMGVEGLTA